MRSIERHFGVGIIIMLFILSISPSINADFNKENLSQSNPPNKIILYKVDSSGQMKPLEVYIKPEEGQDLESSVTKKCKELCENDTEIQQFINTKEGFIRWVEVESKGKGFHWSFRRILLSNRNLMWRSIIRYRYFYAEDYTNIRIKGTDEWITLMEGQQRIRLVGFTGYVSFKPNLLWGNTIIHGYTLRVEWSNPE